MNDATNKNLEIDDGTFDPFEYLEWDIPNEKERPNPKENSNPICYSYWGRNFASTFLGTVERRSIRLIK